jgi:hypothetical protein
MSPELRSLNLYEGLPMGAVFSLSLDQWLQVAVTPASQWCQ